MIEYLIGVDGGGTGTRVRLALAGGAQVGQASGAPSGLALGVHAAWRAVCATVDAAFEAAGLAPATRGRCAIGLGLAGVHNSRWAAEFAAADPGFATLRLASDAYTTLAGAHLGAPGAIIALGTGSVGHALLPCGAEREVGGWGFPSGDEAGGAWIGLRAIGHLQQVLDGREHAGALAHALAGAIADDYGRADANAAAAADTNAGAGLGQRAAVQHWLASATQTRYAALAPLVLRQAESDTAARRILEEAGQQVARMARALDPDSLLPLALCGGLGQPLRAWLPAALLARTTAPQADSAAGALRMIATQCRQETP